MFTDLNDDSSDLEKRIEMQIGRLSIVLGDKFTLDSSLSTEIKLTFFFLSSKGKLAENKTLPRAKHKHHFRTIKIERKKNFSFGESTAFVTS